jgi:ubiquinone/menaquinone biosynthesis C-methylase UbiE
VIAADDEKRGIREEFDSKATEYETNRLAGWYKAHNDMIAQYLVPRTGGVMLDIGCATGYLIRGSLAADPGLSAIGVDLSPRMIEVARQQAEGLTSRAQFICEDWENPEARSSTLLAQSPVSQAVCASALHYFSDPISALARVHETLRPGGAFYLLERRREGSAATTTWDMAHRYLIRDHVRFYSSREMLKMIAQAGFGQAEVVQTVRKYFWNNKISTNLTLIRAIK